MATISVVLKHGFAGENVVVTVDGREVFQRQVRTRMQIDRADACEIPVDAGTHRVGVRIETADGSRTIEANAEAGRMIVVSLVDGVPQVNVADENAGDA
ncbi:MAG: hypothetical protein JNG88_00135 [Phycisphaerales bacterium]|nr:hypothetical protein [Phycisphaerales bacterium]